MFQKKWGVVRSDCSTFTYIHEKLNVDDEMNPPISKQLERIISPVMFETILDKLSSSRPRSSKEGTECPTIIRFAGRLI